MLRLVGVLAGTVGIAAIGLPFVAVNHRLGQSAPANVVVTISCADGRVAFSVDPWQVVVNQGDEIEWTLADTSPSDSIVITPKRGNWPFQASRHRGGRGRANPARARNMRPNQSGRSFPYNITLSCRDGDRDPYTVVIDPDVIVR